MVGSTTSWLLAAVFFGLATAQFGWQGAVLAGTVIAFWMLLQFSRALRVLRKTADRPKGHVESAAVLGSKLRKGMTLAKVLPLTRSLGLKCEAGPGEERWRWADAGGDALTLRFVGGYLVDWTLERSTEPNPP
ncbi:hypothetical protein [Rivibacter subsaxonicus]|uniref:Glycerate kinase n=1 Tax=Rivibacter subsaxonicus TaxID=457575 RepID=A0A4Q7VWM6_9BURK|nr:hypothetical protein [Rivibacter subsaxonicus]RZU01152.1 hypothetical protein EV670_1868 [Rivibacter subsaxonicus]